MTSAESPEPQSSHPQASVFRHRGFRNYWISRLLVSFATQIISVSVGWQVYDLTRNPLDLGIVGLVQFLPSLLFVLVTGARLRDDLCPDAAEAIEARRGLVTPIDPVR